MTDDLNRFSQTITMLWIIQVVIALNFVSNVLAGIATYYTANKYIIITIYHYNDTA